MMLINCDVLKFKKKKIIFKNFLKDFSSEIKIHKKTCCNAKSKSLFMIQMSDR